MRRLAVLAAALTLASTAPAWAGVPGPCKLVTGADAKKALGTSVKAGTPQQVGLFTSCIYVAGAKAVSVLERQVSRGTFDTSAKHNPGAIVKLSGIGSDAYSVKGKSLLLWKDGTEITLIVAGTPGPLKASEALGKAVAARL